MYTTPCERAILDLLAERGVMRRSAIHAALLPRFASHEIARALACLVAHQVLLADPERRLRAAPAPDLAG